MKKTLLAGFLLVLASILFPKPVRAYVQVGCTANGPQYQLSGGTAGNEYICNPGTVKNGSTCVVSPNGYNAGWSPSPAGTMQLTDISGCVPSKVFLGASAYWFLPTPGSFGQCLYGSDPADVSKCRWMNSTVFETALSIGCGLVGCGSANSSFQSSATQFFAGSIGTMMQVRPASSVDYLAYEMSQLHVPGTPQVAYAAGPGIGFNSLTPILKIWTISRNLAYLIFAIVFIVIGFMIMTRQKIDPKTVANVQNALPKIIFALVLVTFSYAIAGFLIDIMYVALGLVVTLATAADPASMGNGQYGAKILSGSIFQSFVDGTMWGTLKNASNAVSTIVDRILGIGPGATFTGQNLPGSVGQAVGQLLGATLGALAFVIIAIAIIIALFRTWLALLGAYANIILGVLFAPLRLTLDAIPGQNQFQNWLKEMLANLLAFPLVLVMLLIGLIIVNTNQGNAGTTGGFVPPLIGGGDFQAATALVGLGILLTIPKALDMLREALKAPQFKFGSAWLESTQAGAQGAQITGRITDRLLTRYFGPYRQARAAVEAGTKQF